MSNGNMEQPVTEYDQFYKDLEVISEKYGDRKYHGLTTINYLISERRPSHIFSGLEQHLLEQQSEEVSSKEECKRHCTQFRNDLEGIIAKYNDRKIPGLVVLKLFIGDFNDIIIPMLDRFYVDKIRQRNESK